jgi:hypothetical protein
MPSPRFQPGNPSNRIPIIERIDYDLETGCWNWKGPRRGGYGRTGWKGKSVAAHRLSAHMFLGMPIDSNAWVCHKCDNPACFNPKHLFIGDRRENTLDSSRKGRHNMARVTHCPKGHEYTPENTFVFDTPSGGKGRSCRACQRFWSARYYKRKSLKGG